MDYKTVNEFLLDRGYKIYMCSADRWMFSFVQEENYAVNVICFFDERTVMMDAAQMDALIEVQKGRLSYGRDKDIHILKIITADTVYIRLREAAHPDDEWYYDSENGRLYVPESAPEDFYGLRYPLTQFLSEQNGLFLEPPESSSEEAMRNADDLERVPARDGVPVTRKVQKLSWNDLPWLSILIVIINVLVYFGQSSGVFDEESFMLTNGILSRPGQWYRLLTYSFLHLSTNHIFSNMMMVYFVGDFLEKKIGRKKFLIVYILSGLAAGIMSVWHHDSIDVLYYGLGASGAVYGIIGAMVAYSVINSIGRSGMTSMIIRLILCFILFFSAGSGGDRDGEVDYTAHMGGFICGFFGSGIWMLVSSLRGRNKKEEKI